MMLGLRTFLKNKKTLNISIAGVVSSVIFLLLVSPVYAGIGDDIAGGVIALFNTLLYVILQTIVYALITAVGILINIGQYPVALDDNIITVGWVVLRDIGNMFFVVALLLISFGTILRLDQYQLKNLLPKVILMAVLVNFSKLIAGVFIEISQIVMLTFVVAYSAAGAGNFMNAMQIPNLTQIWTPSDITNVNTAKPLEHADVFTSLVGGIIYAAIAVVVVLAYIAIFAVRLVALWILVVFSPFAFALNVIPAGQKYASMWWEQFSKYIIVGPVLAFFLWLSLATLPMILDQSGSNNAGTRGQDEIAYIQSIEKNIPGAGSTEALQPVSFLKFILSSVMLIMSLYFAQQIGGTVGNIARMGMSSLSTLGKNAGGLRPALRYWDERRAGAGKKSLNASVYWDAWKSQRDATKQQRMTASVGYAQALAKQGFGKAALGYVGNKMFGESLQAGVDEDGKEIVRLGVIQSVGAGLDVASRQKKYKKEYDDAKRAAAAATNEKASIISYLNLKTRVDSGGGTTGLSKDEKEEYAKLQKAYGDLDDAKLMEEKDRLFTESEKADLKLSEATANSQLTETAVAERLKKEASDEILATEAEIRAIEGGYMGASEVKDAINKNSQEIKKFEDLIKRLAMMGGSDEEKTAADARLRELMSKQDQLVDYQKDMQAGNTDVASIANNTALASLVASQQNKSDQEKKLSELKFSNELAQIRAEGKPLTDVELSRLKDEETKVKARQRDKRVTLAKMQLPLYYQEKARRNMVGDKLKELAGIEDSGELIQIFEKAEAEGDKYMQMAVLNKLAGDGNHNDILNHYNYGSGFDGFKEFYSDKIKNNFGGDAKAEELALRLARDVSYVAESRNHWDQARVVKIDVSGNLDWATEDEHVAAVMGEIKKLNPQKVKREFNRLAVGGEEILANGDVRFIWGKLAQSFLESQYDNIYDAAKPGGDLQKNLAENLLKGLNSLPYDQLVRDGFVQMQKRLDEYVNNPRLAEGKK